MFLTGFADEAGSSIETQIKATKELGWKFIECRNIDGKMMAYLPDERFDDVVRQLESADVHINCYGSGVANWGKDILKEEDFQAGLDELRKAFPRMKRLGTTFLRGMSFKFPQNIVDPFDHELEKNVVTKIRWYVDECSENGVTYLHENCMTWGGMSSDHSLRLLEKVDSPFFKFVFDTGNPFNSMDYRGLPPYKMQDSLQYYKAIRRHIAYVHIKDGMLVPGGKDGHAAVNYTFPTEGHGHVREILVDLLRSGYDGGFSIEPHMTAIAHDSTKKSPEEIMFANYVEYGRRFMALLDKAKKEAGI